jgi:hypothetical protein
MAGETPLTLLDTVGGPVGAYGWGAASAAAPRVSRGKMRLICVALQLSFGTSSMTAAMAH